VSDRADIGQKSESASPQARARGIGSVRELAELTELLTSSIREGLGKFGGREAAESILYILELDFGLNLARIVEGIGEFQKGLEQMFGQSAKVIEDRICSEFSAKIGIDCSGRSLTELLAFAKEYVFRTIGSP
jgi:hypothetical protein